MVYPVQGSVSFSTLDSSGVPRFIGAFLGDGWSREIKDRKDYDVGLAIGTKNQSHTLRYLKLLNKLFPGVNWKNNVPGTFGLSCSSKVVHTLVRNIGIGQDCFGKRLPKQVANFSPKKKMQLLAGFIDADGHVYKHPNHLSRCHLGSANKHLLKQLWNIVDSLGLRKTQIHKRSRMTNKGHQIFYEFTIAGLSMSDIPLWHKKKAKRAQLIFNQ